MKTTKMMVLLVALATAQTLRADEVATNTPAAAASEASAATAPGVPARPPAVTNEVVLLPNGEPGVRLNFRGASLDQVLNYLAEAGGFIIDLQTTVRGKVDVWSNTPLTKDEAVELLNSKLNAQGFAAIRHGRTLTIVNKDEAKTRDIPVVLGSDPKNIPKTDEMVTQIMPVRFVEVAQLLKDLQPLVSTATTMTANEAGNSIIMTDTRANINRVAQIIQAIDQGAEDVTDVRVFPLEYADPTEMAALLSSLFADDGQSGSSQSRNPSSGRDRIREFFSGGGSGSSSTGQNQRMKKRTKVTAVPDPRTSSIIVTATSGMMTQVETMIKQLDANPAKKQKVYVYQVNPGDVSQVQQVLEDMFETTSGNNRNSGRNSSQQNATLQNRATQNQTTTSGTGTGNNRTGGARTSGGGGF